MFWAYCFWGVSILLFILQNSNPTTKPKSTFRGEEEVYNYKQFNLNVTTVTFYGTVNLIKTIVKVTKIIFNCSKLDFYFYRTIF